MSSKLNRRGFFTQAAAGVAAGAAATAAVSAQTSENPPLPVPDSETQASEDGTGPLKEECCAPASKLIFACSGAADVGKIADLSARKLTEENVGKMFCLAGVGGRVKGIMETTKAAKAILAIDGCPLHCGRNTLERAGFKELEHICLADLGMQKGKTPATTEHVDKVVAQGQKWLTAK
jgi:uncharacterized metal-binding protein